MGYILNRRDDGKEHLLFDRQFAEAFFDAFFHKNIINKKAGRRNRKIGRNPKKQKNRIFQQKNSIVEIAHNYYPIGNSFG